MPGQARARNGISLQDLLDALYAAALDPQGWEACLRTLGDAVGGAGPGISVHANSGRQEVLGLDVARSRIEEWEQRYANRLLVACVRNEVGGSFVASAISEIPIWNEFIADWIHPQGFSDLLQAQHVAGENIYGFGVFVERGTRAFDADQIAWVDQLMPHIARVLQLQDRLARIAGARDAASAALEQLAIGFLLLDERARVLETSAGAQRIFAARDGLEIRKSELCVCDSRARARLLRLLGELAAEATHPGGSVPIARPSGRRPYEVLAMRLPRARFRCNGRLATAVLFVTDPENEPHTSEQVLHQLYGLTPAESRVAARLASGRSLAEIADEQRVSVWTVRNQLGSIFSKTQTRRQGELVARLLAGPGRLDPH